MTNHLDLRRVGLRGAAAMAMIALLCAGLFVVATPQEAKAAKPLTPLGQVLVVSNNVFEADKPDARRSGDMKNFVEEILQNSRYAPDIVLVQELRAMAAGNIRDFLTNKTGHKYAIATNAGIMPWKWVKKYTIKRGTDCAVIYNTKTMRKTAGGYILTKHPRKAGNGHDAIEQKRAAWARLVERPRGNSNAKPLQVASVSLHFPRNSNFRSKATGYRFKKRWSAQIARFLNNRFGGSSRTNLHTIAGDFNAFRCTDGTGYARCPTYGFYSVLTNGFNYTDMILEKYTRGNPIDFIFSKGTMIDAWRDDNNPHNPGAPGFYSNHDINWALIGPKRG